MVSSGFCKTGCRRALPGAAQSRYLRGSTAFRNGSLPAASEEKALAVFSERPGSFPRLKPDRLEEAGRAGIFHQDNRRVYMEPGSPAQ